MAYTGVRAVRGPVSRVIRYVCDPEKTTEMSGRELEELHGESGPGESGDSGAGQAAGEREGEWRAYVTCLNCSEDSAAEQFMETQRLWSRITGRDKTAGRSCYHCFQSFREGEVTPELAHEIGVRLAERLWGNDYEVVIATHCNTRCTHNHFVVNAVSRRDGGKDVIPGNAYWMIKEASDRLCLEYGLSVIEEPAARGSRRWEYLAEKRGEPTYRSLIRDDIDRAAGVSLTEREFLSRMEEMGYEFRFSDERGRRLKYPALRPPGAERFSGFHRLGDARYTYEGILERVAANYHREDPFPEKERAELREYRERTEPAERPEGLRGLYGRYSYELHIIRKFPASAERVPLSVREDLIRLDRLDRQTRLLGENGIDTIGELNAFRKKTERKLEELDAARRHLRADLRRAVKNAGPDEILRLKERISRVSGEIKEIRKQIRLCDGIEERSALLREGLRYLGKEQKEKEENEYEQPYRRRGGTGRETVPGRD